MTHPFSLHFAPRDRSVVGNRFGRAARLPGMDHAADVLAGVIAAAHVRGDVALVDAIERHPEEALDYADAAHWRRCVLTPQQREWLKYAAAVPFMKGAATAAQRGVLQRHGHQRAMTKREAAALIAEMRGEVVPVRVPLIAPPRFVAPPPPDAARPRAPLPDLEHLPSALRALAGWLPWRYGRRAGDEEKWHKVPYDPATGRPARWSDPAVRLPFDDVAAAYAGGGYDGVGVVLDAADRLVVIDLDRCLVDGGLTAAAAEIVATVDSYAETTPSGNGLHLWCAATLPGRGIVRPGIELYGDNHFITVTGRRYAESPDAIAPAREAVTALCARFGTIPATVAVAAPPTTRKIPARPERHEKAADRRPSPTALPPPRPSGDGVAILAEVAPFLSDRIRGVADGDRTVAKRDGAAYASESDRVQAVLCGLLRLGLPDEDAIAALLATPLGRAEADERGADIDRWLALSCRNARDWLGDQPPATPAARYVRVDAALLDARLKPSALAVAVVLAAHAPAIFPSQATIAGQIDASTGDVSNQLALLQRRHLVAVIEHRGRQPVYALATTAAPPVRLSMARYEGACRCGKDGLAVLVLFAHGIATQQELADRLGIPPRRVATALRRLEGEGALVGTPGLRNARIYHLAGTQGQSAHI